MSAEKPLVSVSMITYNHEAYIAEAIESVLCQKTSFPFELVIGEDCSTDRTPEIVESYRARYPHIIRVLPNNGRLGASKNAARTFMACRGDYIAVLDGDDYWTCEEKLERQVEILKADPTLSGVFGRTRVIAHTGGRSPTLWPNDTASERWKLRDLIGWQPYHPAALMIRNPRWECWPSWLESMYNLDWGIGIAAAKYGDLQYLNLLVATYRLTGDGIWTRLHHDVQLEHRISSYKKAMRALPFRYKWAFRQQFQRLYLDALWCNYKAGATAKAKYYYWKYLASLCSVQLKHDVRLGLDLYFPRAMQLFDRLRGRVQTERSAHSPLDTSLRP